MNQRSEKLCAWAVVPGMLFFFLAMWPLLHFLPPLSPAMTASQFADIYRAHLTSMRLGSMAMLVGGACLMPFVAAISAVMLRMGGRPAPLAWTQLASGLLTFVPLYLSGIFFAAAAFRGQRGADDILVISDIGWLFLVMPVPPFLLQLFAIGIAVLNDDSARPVFPRWVGYLNFWVGLLSIGGLMVPLFKTGPFAWNGLFAYWLPLTVFGPWMLIMLWAITRAGPGIAEAPDRG